MADQGLFREEGYALMAATFEVHNQMGGGLLEEIYQESLELELNLRKIEFQSHAMLAIKYKGQLLKKRYVPDLIVFRGILVELKAVKTLADEHTAQLLNYMRISGQRVGYLINFAPITKLEWKRLVL